MSFVADKRAPFKVINPEGGSINSYNLRRVKNREREGHGPYLAHVAQ